jgi:hypothetical protein
MVEAHERTRSASDERLLECFDPDVVLPSQHFAALQRKRFPSGEHRLLVALIEDAIECVQKHLHARDAKRQQLFADARDWIVSEDDRGVFSFNNVCMLLGMNPDYVREGLDDWCERAAKEERRERRRAPGQARPVPRIVPATAPELSPAAGHELLI